MQLQAEAKAQQAGGQASINAADSTSLAATHQQQLLQLHYQLQQANQAASDAEQEAKHAAERHQRQTEAQSQQLQTLEAQLEQLTSQVEQYNQQRLDAEQKLLEAQDNQQPLLPATSESDSVLLQNLRDELAAQSADVAEARRLKSHVRCSTNINISACLSLS